MCLGRGVGASNFIGLSDTPPSFSGQQGRFLKVNSGSTALEFTDEPSGGGGGASDFTGLSDTPRDYTGQSGKILEVNSGESGLEFVDKPTGGGGGSPDTAGQIRSKLESLSGGSRLDASAIKDLPDGKFIALDNIPTNLILRIAIYYPGRWI